MCATFSSLQFCYDTRSSALCNYLRTQAGEYTGCHFEVSKNNITISFLIVKTFIFILLSERDATAAEDRELLVKNLKSLGADLTESLEFNDHQLTETLLSEFKDVWRGITQQHNSVSPSVDDDVINANDDLMDYAAKLLFLAKFNSPVFVTLSIIYRKGLYVG